MGHYKKLLPCLDSRPQRLEASRPSSFGVDLGGEAVRRGLLPRPYTHP